MNTKLEELKHLLREAGDLAASGSILHWDMSTFMPPGGGPARGRQLALLQRLAHERATNPAIGRLLDELQPYAESLPYDHEDAAMLRLARREYDRLTKVPASFIGEMSEHQSATYQAWSEARPANDWPRLLPMLEKTLDFSRRLADFFPGYQHIADPLIDFNDYGMKAESVRRVFAELRAGLTPLIQAVAGCEPVDDSVLRKHYPQADQLAFADVVIRDLGYDFQRGRMDLSPHPFTTMFSIGDVRITTRVKEDDFGDCFFSAAHEAGHAMHVLGCNPAYEGTPLASFGSAGLAESQSRTWENLVARSRPFWEHYFPRAQAAFPQQLGGVDMETFYRAVNKVTPSLIRTDADEVTYNLHPMIRFEFELALLEGSLAVKDLPEAWHARYESDLGVRAPDDRDGVLQDVHWFAGLIGGSFQGYTLGNIMSAMFFEKALEAHPEIPDQMRQGQFGTLHRWLIDNIYWPGGRYTTMEYVQRVTGSADLDVQPLLRYFQRKYGEIYNLAG